MDNINDERTHLTQVLYRETFAVDWIKSWSDYYLKEFMNGDKEIHTYQSHYHVMALQNDGSLIKLDLLCEDFIQLVGKPVQQQFGSAVQK